MKKSHKLDPVRAFRVCSDMERTSALFYAEAARLAGPSRAREVFSRLAEIGHGHAETFEAIIASKKTDRKFMKPFQSKDVLAYVRHLSEKTPFTSLLARGRFTVDEAIRSGTEAAKTAILYYTELKNLADPQTRAVFDRVLQEEKSHYVMLSELAQESD